MLRGEPRPCECGRMTASQCDTCGKGMENMRLLKKLTETEIENDELKCQIEILDIAFDVKRNDLRKLLDENAKLRKIARLCVQAIKDCGCDPCPHYDEGTCPVEIYPMRDGCKLYAEMCELGIEVG